jgi:proline dehydrogenase
MGFNWLVKLGTRVTPWAIKNHLPINGLIRNTIFQQFVGGETLEETAKVASRLQAFDVKVILDYGAEGKEGEENFNHACQEFIRVVNYAGSQKNIPFISIKVTAFARFSLLEKLHLASMGNCSVCGEIVETNLSAAEKEEWQQVVHRMDKIMAQAAVHHIGVLVDAEESWIQDPVDALTMQMMQKYNKEHALVFNTVQLYRHDRLTFLKESFQQAASKNFILGVKLVRGAYMEKERRHAEDLNQTSPIQINKDATDRDYNLAVEYCINHLDKIATVVATHNEFSNLHATDLLKSNQLSAGHPHIHFSQLYGMSDNITFNLAKAGCSVSKYLPFGPIKDVIPYLMRRAEENSSVSGQTGRELALIKQELKRRRKRESGN